MASSSRSLRNRKQQTRLQFQPLSSSSPTKQNYSAAIQDRLANVRYDGVRRSTRSTAQSKHLDKPLSIPQLASPVQMNVPVYNVSSPLSSLRTSPTLPPRFTDTSFDEPSDEDDIIVPSSKRRKLSTLIEDEDMGNQPSKPREVRPDRRTSPHSIRSSPRPKNVGFSTPSRRSTRLVNRTATPIRSSSSSSSQYLVSIDVPTPSKRTSNLGSAESTDDDTMITKPPSARRRTSKQTSRHEDHFIVPDDEDVLEVSEEAKSRNRSRKRRNNHDDFVVSDNEITITSGGEDGGEAGNPESSKSRQHNSTPKMRNKRLKQRLMREQEEIAEDLLDLQDSDQDAIQQKGRTRGGPVTTQRDKTKEHFEKLKRRRAGEKASRVIDSDDEDNLYNSDEGVDINNIGQETNSVQVISDDSLSQGIEDQEFDGDLDANEDDFVVEDRATAGRLGGPSNDLPLQFTSFASAKPRQLFPHIIEWMVKNKISPAFNRNDEIYDLSFSRIDDQVKAQAGSRLISSAWNATFKYAILARPGIHVTALPGMDEDLIRTCDACNRSNHPARYDFTFSDKAYSKETLEPLDDSDDDINDDDNENEQDGASCDEQDHVLASRNTHFYLGRFCAANAEMGHKLTHWKHSLNKQVLSFLEEQDILSAEAIIAREKLNKKRREKEAEAIVDNMEETGMIDALWQAFQDDLDDARIGMEGHEKRGGRNKARIGSVRTQRNNGRVGEWNEGGKFRQLPIHLESNSEGE